MELPKDEKYDLKDINERRKYFQEHPEIFPKVIQKLFIKNQKHYKTIDDAQVSWFIYNFAQDPQTRHEAHWQLHSYLLLEIKDLIQELVELLKGQQQQESKSALKRRETQKK